MTVTTSRIRPLDMTDADFRAWLVTSQKSIGGSDVGAITGVSPYKTAADVWDAIMDEVPRSEDNANMARGRALEPVVADLYAQTTGRTLRTRPSVRLGDWVRVSVDRMIQTVPERRGRGVLEIKVPMARNYRVMRLQGVDAMYHAQLQWYMGHLGCQWGAFAIFNADDWALFHHDVDADPRMFAELYDAVATFWTEHVLARVRPGAAGDDALRVQVPRTGGEATVVDEDASWAPLLARLRAAQEHKKLAEHAFDLAKLAVQEQMTAAEADIITGEFGTIHWTDVPSRSFDVKAFQRAHPDLDLAPFYREKLTRPFRPFFGKET